MTQVLILRVLLFLLPFVLYAGYVRFVKGGRLNDPAHWDARPLAWLLVASVVIVGSSLFWLAGRGAGDKDGTYTPAHMKDGELVPGKIDDEDEREE